VFQPVLPLHDCADPAATQPLHSIADSVAKPLHSVADSAATGATPTETS
jgi:hypothetical protein